MLISYTSIYPPPSKKTIEAHILEAAQLEAAAFEGALALGFP